jgi:hypothetical protein
MEVSLLIVNKDAFKKYIEDIDKHIELTKSTNKSLLDWMNPIINSLTDDGAVSYLLNTNERFRASPLSSTIIWLQNAGLLSSDVLRTMQNKLIFLKDECQENDPKGNYDKYEDDKDGWSLAEGVSIWSTSLAIIALFDSDNYGLKLFPRFRASIIWLANQQDVNKKGWAYQAFDNCDVNEITSALAMQALAKVYKNIELLDFNNNEKKLIIRTLINGFQYIKDVCIKSKTYTYWCFNGKYSFTATTWILVALSELITISDIDNEIVDFYRNNKKRSFRYILSKMPQKQQKWADEQIVSEAGAKYSKQKNYYSFTPALIPQLLKLGISPYEPKIIKQIKWLLNNQDSWKISEYDKGRICTFTYAMIIATLVTWIRAVGLCLSSQLLYNPISIFQKARYKVLGYSDSNRSHQLLIIDAKIILLFLILLNIFYFVPSILNFLKKINDNFILFWNEVNKKENQLLFRSILASLIASAIGGIIIMLRKKIVAFALKIKGKAVK